MNFKQKCMVRAFGLLALSMVAVGCGTDGDDDDDSPADTSEVEVTAAMQSGATRPLDAIPSPDGETLFLVAEGESGKGVFSVPGDGGTAEALHTGAPLVGPRGISTSTDGSLLYVADPDASLEAGDGAIFVVARGGAHTIAPVSGTEDTQPTALDVVSQGGADQIYFAGVDPADGSPAIFKVPAAGGSRSVVAKAPELVRPDGVAVDGDGRVYVADADAAGDGMGRVFRFGGGVLSTVVEEVLTGDPAGIALTLDHSTLLISSINPEEGTDQVILLDTETLGTGIFTDVIGANHDGGGVHRAHERDIFAWADLTAGTAGTVYKVTFK